MTSIGILGAFLGGVLSLLSPCSAMLLPAFFAYAFSNRGTLIARTGLFFLGLATVLVPIGMGLGGVGSLVVNHRETLMRGGGILLVVFGLMSLLGLGFSIPGLNQLAAKAGGTTPLQVFLTGCVYGFAGFCAGPLLGAVLTQSLMGGASLYGGILMFAYSLGMTIPLFLLALLWRGSQQLTARLTRGTELGPFHFTPIGVVSGLLFIGLGALFLVTGGALPALISTAAQAKIQAWVVSASAGLSDAMLLAALAALGAVVLLMLYFRKR